MYKNNNPFKISYNTGLVIDSFSFLLSGKKWISFKNKDNIKLFFRYAKGKRIHTSRPSVQEILKEVFQQKEKLCQIEI